jgi:acylphosphatase
MERIEAIVSGKVQMVWYRDFATRTAEELGITGTTCNLPDGTVHVVAEGPREELETYIEHLWKGSEQAEVKGVDVVWKKATGEFDNFCIV